VACEILSNFFQDFHRSQGVTIELNAGRRGVGGHRRPVTGVRLGDGRLIPCDAALIGVAAWQTGVGAGGGDRLRWRHPGRSGRAHLDPDIFAIGDCTRRPLPLYNRTMRLESVPNALEQAKQAASAIAAVRRRRRKFPWFWSDQYDLRLQIVGIPFDAAEIVVRGDIAAGKFALFHLAVDGIVQAVEAVNAPPSSWADGGLSNAAAN